MLMNDFSQFFFGESSHYAASFPTPATRRKLSNLLRNLLDFGRIQIAEGFTFFDPVQFDQVFVDGRFAAIGKLCFKVFLYRQ